MVLQGCLVGAKKYVFSVRFILDFLATFLMLPQVTLTRGAPP